MSTSFLKRLGYNDAADVMKADDIVAMTTDQAVDGLERALEALKSGNIAEARGEITGAISQLIHVVAAGHRMSAPKK